MGDRINIIFYILIFVNIAGFIVVGVDKLKSRRKAWRIPERVFFWFALIGGCVGVYSGFLIFKHKTRHWYFMLGIPLIFALQIIGVYYLSKI